MKISPQKMTDEDLEMIEIWNRKARRIVVYTRS